MADYIPERNDIVSLDFEPKKRKRGGNSYAVLVLSSKDYNEKTGLLIGCPVSTDIEGHVTEVPIDDLEKPSVVTASLVHTLAWRERQVKFITKVKNNVMGDVLSRLVPLIGADRIVMLRMQPSR